MTAACRPWAAQLLQFWFHDLRPAQWFARNDRIDAEMRRRFARDWQAQRHRSAADFLVGPRIALGAVLLFDQVPRNLFRNDPRAYASDALARAIAKGAMAHGWDLSLGKAGRQFLYMPLMHSEAVADQLLGLHLFGNLGNRTVFDIARDHASMVRRFGRFPHRNTVLGRLSTAAEQRAVAQGHAW